ncbi:MAG: NHL repeat-containing protein [Gammaproteobacteria bacterium]
MKRLTLNSYKTLFPLGAGIVLSATVSASDDPETRMPPGAKKDTTADLVLGQLDFTHNGTNFIDGRGIDSAPDRVGDVIIDKSVSPNRVYVVDRRNHRVLGWKNISAFGTHGPANIVIGQPDFLSGACNNGGVTAASLCNPTGVAVDSAGNLYVADTSNHRVLFYKKPFNKGIPAGMPADDVFGQYGSFTTNFCNAFGTSQNTLCNPVRVALDAGNNLYVSDQSNNRVLGYRTPEKITTAAGSGDTTADRVFGQFGSFNTSVCNNSGISSKSLCTPAGLAVDASKNLYAADFGNHRVLKYNSPFTTNTVADKVYGQLNKFNTNVCNNGGLNKKSLCNPVAVAVDPAGAVYIADQGNHRVLAYPTNGSTAANKVLGQFGSFNTNSCNNTGGGTLPPGANPRNLCNPDGIALDKAVSPDSPKLYVSDTSNNRVLQYRPSGTPLVIKSGQAAKGVLGQALLNTNLADFVDGRGIATTEFNEGAVAIDRSVTPNRIYVSDPSNNRVLAWNTVAAFTTHAPATLVFGQPNAFATLPNNGGISNKSLNRPRALAVDGAGNLYVADQSNHRVLMFKTPFTSGTVADGVFGQTGFTTNGCNFGGLSAKSLCTPAGLALDSSGNLYVGDFSNNRVLKYQAPLTNKTAVKVYGQSGNFTLNTCNLGGISADSLCGAHGLAVDAADNLYVADSSNSRILEFNKLPVTDSTADIVFGQGDSFTTNDCNGGGVSAGSLCRPRFVTTNIAGSAVFIADTDNQRVLKYNAPLTTNRTADRVFGQGNLFNTNGCKSLGPNSLCVPDGIAVDGANNLYIVDSDNNRVLEFLKP